MTPLRFVFLALFAPAILATQDGSFSDQARWKGSLQFGTPKYDACSGVAVDTRGNIYVTGFTDGDLDGNTNRGEFDSFVVKFDSSGIRQWTDQLGTAGSDVSNAIALDENGNIYIAGHTSGGLDANTNRGASDIFVAKFHPDGKREWTRQVGTAGDDLGRGIAIFGNDSIYVVGFTRGGLVWDSNLGTDALVVIKYNPSGIIQWSRQIGTAAGITGDGIAVDGKGDVYVTGTTKGSVEDYLSRGADLFVAKYDPSGSLLWNRSLGTPGHDSADGVAVDRNGNVYIIGSTSSSLERYSPRGMYDFSFILAKYDSLGVQQWTQQLSTTASVFGHGIFVDINDNIYVTGQTGGNLEGHRDAGSGDVLVAKYSSSGLKQWVRQFGTERLDVGQGIAVAGKGDVYVVGYTDGSLDGNFNRGHRDAFVVKYSSTGVKQCPCL